MKRSRRPPISELLMLSIGGVLRSPGERPVGLEGEVLGKVTLLSRERHTLPLPGRIGDLAHNFGPLVALPILQMAGR